MKENPDSSVTPTMSCKPALFWLGQVVATPAALETLHEHGVEPATLLTRHAGGDWGDVPPEDAESNDVAIASNDRVLSAYAIAPGIRIWVITEHDRSSTTILLPSEY